MTFSPLLFAADAKPTQPVWGIVLMLVLVVVSAPVWICWRRSVISGREFFGPRDPRSEKVKPWGQVVLVGFLGMLLMGTILAQIYLKQREHVPADPAAPERLALQFDLIRLSVAANLITLALVLGFSYMQVRITDGEILPWLGVIPNARDVRNGLLLGLACVPLLYVAQALLQYLLVVVLEQPRIEHPLIELLRKIRVDDPALLNEFFAWIVVSVTLVAPLLEELLFRGLLQGWLRAKYQAMTAKILARSPNGREVPGPASENPYGASQDRVLTSAAELQRHRLTMWAPIFISSMAFALVHVGHGPAPIPIFFFALALGYAYEKTGRLAPSIIAHLMLNLTTTVMLWLMISGVIPAD